MTAAVRSALACLIAALGAAPAPAAASYEGKTITIITSTGEGGIYDVIARALARTMPRHLDGAPTMIVQNMPGGGNLRATNFVYNVAPKDGTTIATLESSIPLHQVIDGRGVRYDANRFNWLGSTGAENSVVIAWHTSGIRTIKDAMDKEVVLGGTGIASNLVRIPAAMNNVLGTRFKIVVGYKSVPEVDIAMERGEIQARASGLATIHPDWIKSRKINFLAQVGAARDRTLPDIPLLTDVAKTDLDREILKLISAPRALGYSFVAPPGLSPEQVAILRKAFQATLRDKAFLTEMQKVAITIDPMSAEAVAKVVADTIGAGADVVAKAKAAIEVPR
jgi:tripartite-type tricarboxylate transporter receptor subunit TctC